MGDKIPSYTSAIMKDCDMFYFFDPHSRSFEGLPISNGLATVTIHDSLTDIVKFIYHMSGLLFQDAIGSFIPFEVQKVSTSVISDSDTDWSGFSELSEGEVSCRLHIAHEKMTEALTMNVSTPSCTSDSDDTDSYSVDSLYFDKNKGSETLKTFDQNDSLNSIPNLNSTYIDVYVTQDSNVQSNSNLFSSVDVDDCNDKNGFDGDDEFDGSDYEYDSNEENVDKSNVDDDAIDYYDDDDNIPLSHLARIQNKNVEHKNKNGATNVSNKSEKRKARKRTRNTD